MAFLFKRTPKTPHELVRTLSDYISKLNGSNEGSPDRKRAQDEIGRTLSQMRALLQSEDSGTMVHELMLNDALGQLVEDLILLDEDSRKDVAAVLSTLLRLSQMEIQVIDYLCTRPHAISFLLRGPEQKDPSLVLIIGAILRECIRHEALASKVLNNPLFWNYFQYAQAGSFENATDAFSTLHDLLTTHKKLAGEFFANNLPRFISQINSLVGSGNYVTKRQSIKLLAHLMLQRSNYILMTNYVDSPENLKLIMILLGDRSKNIQYEAFHVFKVFVANPKKYKPVADILIKNRDKLLTFLTNFNPERRDDAVFNEERQYLIHQIQELPRLTVSTTSSSMSNNNASPDTDKPLSARSVTSNPISRSTTNTTPSPNTNSYPYSLSNGNGNGASGNPHIPGNLYHSQSTTSLSHQQLRNKSSRSGSVSSKFTHPHSHAKLKKSSTSNNMSSGMIGNGMHSNIAYQ